MYSMTFPEPYLLRLSLSFVEETKRLYCIVKKYPRPKDVDIFYYYMKPYENNQHLIPPLKFRRILRVCFRYRLPGQLQIRLPWLLYTLEFNLKPLGIFIFITHV